MKSQKKNGRFYLALVIFCLTGQVAWTVENMYFNVFIYKMFHASAEAISAMVAASAVAATVTTLLIGALSDKLGKRKIFICGGYILWGISIWSFTLIRMDVINALFPAAVSAASTCGSCKKRLLHRIRCCGCLCCPPRNPAAAGRNWKKS